MIRHSRFKLFISVSSGWYLMLRVSLNEQDEARFGTIAFLSEEHCAERFAVQEVYHSRGKADLT